MRLAEALMERGDLQRRIEQLRSRIASSARYQEGEDPGEDAGALLTEVLACAETLTALIARINVTNSTVTTSAGESLTHLLAARDGLRLRHSLLSGAADQVTGAAGYRQLRSELKSIAALPAAELRARADETARELRALDARIQQLNWEVDLLPG